MKAFAFSLVSIVLSLTMLPPCDSGDIIPDAMAFDTSSHSPAEATWQIEVVDGNARGSNSLDLDSSGYPHIGYESVDAGNADLKYAHITVKQHRQYLPLVLRLGSHGL